MSDTVSAVSEVQGGAEIHRIRRTRTPALLVPLAALLLIGAACGGVSKPQGWAEPQLDGGTLYVSLDRGKMSAVNTDDFTVVWEFPKDKSFACGGGKEEKHDLESIYGAPLIDGGVVYFGAYDGNVYAVDAETGDCVWESHKSQDEGVQCKDREPEGPIVGGLALVDDQLYFGSDDGQVWGIDQETGAVHSCRDVEGAVWSTPLVVDKVLYVATMEGAVWAMEAGDWHPRWSEPFRTDAALLTDPVLAGDKIIVGGIGKTLFAIDIKTGKQQWAFDGGNWFWGKPAPDADGVVVYATNLDGKVYAVDVATGAAAWDSNNLEAPEAIRAGALLADDVLVVVDRGGNVYSLDPDTGEKVKESLSVIEKRVLANPIEFDGAVLVAAEGGDLYQIAPTGDAPPKLLDVKE
jgi:outer membrane protein assembly factor BamB